VGICRAHKKGILILEAGEGVAVQWKDYHTNASFKGARWIVIRRRAILCSGPLDQASLGEVFVTSCLMF
jgi:hypothetical protein